MIINRLSYRATFCLTRQVTGKDMYTVSVDRFHVFDYVDKEDKGQTDNTVGKNRRGAVCRRNF